MSPQAGSVVHPSSDQETPSIDIHCHIHTEKAAELAKEVFRPEKVPAFHFANEQTNDVNRKQLLEIHPQLTSVDTRIVDMDRMGIDIQAISPSPFQYYYDVEAGLGRELAQTINDHLAQIVVDHPDRFVALGTLPLQEPQLALEEMHRCVNDLGVRGFEICSQVDGTELSRAGLGGIFAAAESLETLLFMHPVGFTHADRLCDHYFNNVIGMPLDSTIAVSHLIFDGVLERHPDLKLCIAHGGGYLPGYAGRMDHAYRMRPDCRETIDELPSNYLRRLYFDSLVFDTRQLEHLVRTYGAEHILLGTDYPFDMGETDPVGHIQRTESLSPKERTAIIGGNAAKLLGLKETK